MLIVGFFFSAIYALNSQCLYTLNSGRKAFSASEALQDRMEQLRSCKWSQITDANYLKNSVLNTASSDSAFLNSCTETVTVSAYPVPSPAQSFTVTRQANGSVPTPTTNAAVANGDLVRIDVTLDWMSSPGNRARSAAICTVYGEGTR
jgi:hypothetical protein